jgi:hypothetical protein
MNIIAPKSLLTQSEIKALRPNEREDYVRAAILEILRKNDRGVTVSEVMDSTLFNRVTITKHLEYLVAIREAYKIDRGIGTVYFKNGKIAHETDKLTISCGRKTYDFFKLENPEGIFIYIQEKEQDEMRAMNVKGGIMIPFDYFQDFVTGLLRFTRDQTKPRIEKENECR